MSELDIYESPQSMLSDASAAERSQRLFAWNGRLGRLRFGALCCAILVLHKLIQHILVMVWAPPNIQLLDSTGKSTFLAWYGVYTIAQNLVLRSPLLWLARRRLQDMNFKGWWALLLLPFDWTLFLIIPLFLIRGTEGDNRYGPVPPVQARWKILPYVLGLVLVLYNVWIAVMYYILPIMHL